MFNMQGIGNLSICGNSRAKWQLDVQWRAKLQSILYKIKSIKSNNRYWKKKMTNAYRYSGDRAFDLFPYLYFFYANIRNTVNTLIN